MFSTVQIVSHQARISCEILHFSAFTLQLPNIISTLVQSDYTSWTMGWKTVFSNLTPLSKRNVWIVEKQSSMPTQSSGGLHPSQSLPGHNQGTWSHLALLTLWEEMLKKAEDSFPLVQSNHGGTLQCTFSGLFQICWIRALRHKLNFEQQTKR